MSGPEALVIVGAFVGVAAIICREIILHRKLAESWKRLEERQRAIRSQKDAG